MAQEVIDYDDIKYRSGPDPKYGDFSCEQWRWIIEEYARMNCDEGSEGFVRNGYVELLIEDLHRRIENQSDLFAEIISDFGKDQLKEMLDHMPTTRREMDEWYPEVSMELMESGKFWDHYRKSRFSK
jgi:hypothetical protein